MSITNLYIYIVTKNDVLIEIFRFTHKHFWVTFFFWNLVINMEFTQRAYFKLLDLVKIFIAVTVPGFQIFYLLGISALIGTASVP